MAQPKSQADSTYQSLATSSWLRTLICRHNTQEFGMVSIGIGHTMYTGYDSQQLCRTGAADASTAGHRQYLPTCAKVS